MSKMVYGDTCLVLTQISLHKWKYNKKAWCLIVGYTVGSMYNEGSNQTDDAQVDALFHSFLLVVAHLQPEKTQLNLCTTMLITAVTRPPVKVMN